MHALGAQSRRRLAVGVVIAGLLLTAVPATVVARHASSTGLTPIVLFPAWHFTRLQVTVTNQRTDPACPRSGTFEDLVFLDPGPAFSQVCRDELLTLRYDAKAHKPMRLRFSEQPGVTVQIADYGRTESAPALRGHVRGARGGRLHPRPRHPRRRLRRPADARTWPASCSRSKRLIEETYRQNGNRPVHVVGHSNGPIYIQYLLTHTSAAWKAKYIHGFTPLAGNFPGQGLGYALMFVGVNIPDLAFPATPENAVSSARMFLSHPSTFITASDPKIFGDQEIVIRDQSTGTDYTPQDYPQLFDDAGIPWATAIGDSYIGGVPFADPAHFPNVDVYAEKGSGLDTLVGLGLADLTIGQQVIGTTEFLTRDGDINQEDLTNDAVGAWAGDGLLPLQPHRQPRRHPLRAAVERGGPGSTHRQRERAAFQLQLSHQRPDEFPWQRRSDG